MNDLEFKYDNFTDAVRNGNLENMKWLYNLGYRFKSDLFTKASLNGNLDIMKWLFSVGCPWDPGHLDLLL